MALKIKTAFRTDPTVAGEQLVWHMTNDSTNSPLIRAAAWAVSHFDLTPDEERKLLDAVGLKLDIHATFARVAPKPPAVVPTT